MRSGPLSEETEAIPTNPYGFAKNALRLQLEYLQRQQPFNLTWARLFYSYGDGQSEQSLFSQLQRAVRGGAATFAMSGGEQLRDFIPVSEVAEYLVTLALMSGETGCVNICSGVPVSVRSFVEGWLKEQGRVLDLDFGAYPYPDYEPMAFWGVRTRLDRLMAAR
jgi:dTDP-6-deoxy-L-talose 4-dehydrogenase (NAD+)